MRTASSACLCRPLRGLDASDGRLAHGLAPVAGDGRPLRGLSAKNRGIGGWPTSSEVGDTNSVAEFAFPTAKAMGHPTRKVNHDATLGPGEELHEYGEVMQVDIAVHLEVEHGAGRIQLRDTRAAEAGAKGAEVNQIDVTVLVRIIKRG